MTLLVISLVSPTTTTIATNGKLGAYLNHLFVSQNGHPGPFEVYAIGFVIIAVWWRLHVRIFRDIKAADGTIFWLDVLYLLFVAVTPFTISIVLNFGSDPYAGAFYSADQMFVGLMGATIRLQCHRRPELNKGPAPTDRQVLALFATPGVFGAATLVSLVSPIAAEVLWFGAVVVGGFIRRFDSTEKLRLKAGEIG